MSRDRLKFPKFPNMVMAARVETTSRGFKEEYFHLTGHLTAYSDLRGETTGLPVSPWEVGEFYNGFQINSQAHSERGDKGFVVSELYAWECRYHDVIDIKWQKAEVMHFVLGQIDAKLRRIADKEGAPLSYGQFFTRVCRAIGIDTIVRISPSGEIGRDHFPVMNYRKMTLGEAVGDIDHQFVIWKHNKLEAEEKRQSIA